MVTSDGQTILIGSAHVERGLTMDRPTAEVGEGYMLSREEMLILCDRKAIAHGYSGIIDFVLKNPEGIFELGRDQELAMMVGLPWGD